MLVSLSSLASPVVQPERDTSSEGAAKTQGLLVLPFKGRLRTTSGLLPHTMVQQPAQQNLSSGSLLQSRSPGPDLAIWCIESWSVSVAGLAEALKIKVPFFILEISALHKIASSHLQPWCPSLMPCALF
ncbi:hypothetical protein LEMLEM_LOCUS14679 [Lemmus lemmus]